MNTIHIYEAIGEGFAGRFKTQLAAFAGKPVTVRINSPGGAVFEGLTAHSLLKNHGAKVTVCIDGIAASIASVIAMAGDEIRIAPAGMLMIHDASLATRGTAAQLAKDADTVAKISDNLAGIYAARTKQPLAKVRALMLAETWLTAPQAVALGFATKLDPGLKAVASAAWNAADCPGIPAAALVAAGLSTRPSMRQQSAEIDRLRSRVLELAGKVSTQPAPHVAGIGRGRTTGTAPLFNPPMAKPAPTASAPRFPTLEKFEALKGDEAANFYRANKRQILTDERDRKQYLAAIEKQSNDARARTGKGFAR